MGMAVDIEPLRTRDMLVAVRLLFRVLVAAVSLASPGCDDAPTAAGGSNPSRRTCASSFSDRRRDSPIFLLLRRHA